MSKVQRLAPRFLGASVFAPTGTTNFYADAQGQLNKLYSLSRSYPGSDPESTASAIYAAVEALKNDVANFTSWDSKFVTGSNSWAQLLASEPVPDPSGTTTWPVSAAPTLNDAVFALQTLVPTVARPTPPARTSTPVVTAVRPMPVATAAVATPVATSAPVTVIVQSPPAKKLFPWNYALLGAGIVGVGYLVWEKHGGRRRR